MVFGCACPRPMAKTSSSAADSVAASDSPTNKRLGASSFERVFSNGSKVNGAYCSLRYLTGSGRIGIAVSRKLAQRNSSGTDRPDSTARASNVRRNRVRRRFREAIRLSTVDWSAFDIVVVAKASSEDASFDSLIVDIRTASEALRARSANER